MKIIIFAGGAGTRLWPLSRENSPKQFDQFFDNKSTLQLMVDRVRDLVGIENIYISTNENFKDIVLKQINDLPETNLILEPARRDNAAAILLAFKHLEKDNYSDSVAILWADHLMKRVDDFQNALKIGEDLIKKNSQRFVYFAERPRFANQNLGWIQFGKEISFTNGKTVREFVNWKYRPEIKQCEEMFDSNDWYWNTGYWVTSVSFVLNLFKQFKPEMNSQMETVFNTNSFDEYNDKLHEIYPNLESISFDNAIVEKTNTSQAVVILNDFGWYDPGTLYALKEALEETPKGNVTKGEVYTYTTEDSLIINYEKDKLVTTIGLKGFIIINMDDTLVVVHKDNVPKVKELVGELKKDESLKKYT